MNEEERGRHIKGIIETAFPTLPPAGAVGTGMALDAHASWVRAQLEQLPELADISTGMKHHAGVAELAAVVYASRPTADPTEVVFGIPGARVGTGELIQAFVTATTDGRPARYFDGLPDWMREQGALRHINGFAAEYEPDYGFYRTPGGRPRVADHHPTSSGIDDAEILTRYQDARARALDPNRTVGKST